MLPLDVQNTREGTNIDMQMMWYIVLLSSLFYMCIVLPYGLFFSETNEDLPWTPRLCNAFKWEIITIAVISCILFPTYVYMKFAYIPITAYTCASGADPLTDPFIDATEIITADYTSPCVSMETTLIITVGFPIYAITFMSFIGWFLLMFFLPTGMWAIPFNWIGQWVLRPKPMREDEFNRAKADLAKKVQTLL